MADTDKWWLAEDWPRRDGLPLACPCCGGHDLDTADIRADAQRLPAAVTCCDCDASCDHPSEVLALTTGGWVDHPTPEQLQVRPRGRRDQLRLRDVP